MDIVIILPAKRKTEIVKEYTMQKQGRRNAVLYPVMNPILQTLISRPPQYIYYYLTATGTTAVFFTPL